MSLDELASQFLYSHGKRLAKDAFERYKLGDPLRERGEKLRLEDRLLTEGDAISPENDVTNLYDKMITARMEEEDNNLILWLDGEKRSGKSMGARDSAVKIRRAYLHARNLKPTPSRIVEGIQMAFNNDQAAEELPKLEPGHVLVRDEGEISEGEEKINQANNITNVNTTSGAAQFNFIYCDPKASINLKIYDFKLRPYGKDKKARKTRFLIWDFHGTLLGHIILSLLGPEFKKFEADYNLKKMGNINAVKDAGGKVSAAGFSKTDEKTVRRLIEKIQTLAETGVKVTKGRVQVLLGKMKVPGSIRKKNNIVESALMDWETGKAARGNAVATEIVHGAQTFPDFFKSNSPDLSDDYREAVVMFLAGYSQRDIEHELNLTRDKVRGFQKEARKRMIGNIFERYCAFLVGVPVDQIPQVCAAEEHVPDLIWNEEIYSFKWRFNKDPSESFYLEKKEHLLQENRAALQAGKPFHLLYTNRAWGAEILHILVTPAATGEVKIEKTMLSNKSLIYAYTVPPVEVA